MHHTLIVWHLSSLGAILSDAVVGHQANWTQQHFHRLRQTEHEAFQEELRIRLHQVLDVG